MGDSENPNEGTVEGVVGVIVLGALVGGVTAFALAWLVLALAGDPSKASIATPSYSNLLFAIVVFGPVGAVLGASWFARRNQLKRKQNPHTPFRR